MSGVRVIIFHLSYHVLQQEIEQQCIWLDSFFTPPARILGELAIKMWASCRPFTLSSVLLAFADSGSTPHMEKEEDDQNDVGVV